MGRARTFADLATASEASNLGKSNIFINGNFAIAQRATSSTSSGMKTVDRWSCDSPSLLGITQTQEPTATTDTPYGEGFRNFF